jgi:hypothetical protein
MWFYGGQEKDRAREDRNPQATNKGASRNECKIRGNNKKIRKIPSTEAVEMKKLIFILVVFAVLVSGCVGKSEPQVDEFHAYLDKNLLTFRANLTLARNTEINFSGGSCKEMLYPEVFYKTIYVAFIPNDTENGFYAATGSEIGKYVIMYRYFYDDAPEIKPISVKSIKEAASMVSDKEIVILMLGPSQTNKTGVTLYKNFVVIEGQSLDETNRTWTDLDLAFDRYLLCILDEANKYIKK